MTCSSDNQKLLGVRGTKRVCVLLLMEKEDKP
jgi:hypothetical protein